MPTTEEFGLESRGKSRAIEVVKKAASGAVESIHNSRRKFGTYQKAATRSDSKEGEG